MRLVMPYIKRRMSRQFAAELANLKAILEA
jgi:hypothetical protein